MKIYNFPENPNKIPEDKMDSRYKAFIGIRFYIKLNFNNF